MNIFSISFFSIYIYPPTFKYCAMFENLDKCYILWASQVINNSPANAGDARDLGSISRSGRFPGVGNGNPLQYSSLENPMNREVWRAAVHEVTKSQDKTEQLSTHAWLYFVIIYQLSFHSKMVFEIYPCQCRWVFYILLFTCYIIVWINLFYLFPINGQLVCLPWISHNKASESIFAEVTPCRQTINTRTINTFPKDDSKK